MKFYDRQKELTELNKLMGQARGGSRMAVMTGRRRVGKTLLSLEFVKGRKHLYFFVAKTPLPNFHRQIIFFYIQANYDLYKFGKIMVLLVNKFSKKIII